MLEDLLMPFMLVGAAEMGDKTQLSLLLLSSKTKKRLPLLAGASIAFLIVDGIAVTAGSWITGVLPPGALKTASGLVFMAFGLLILREKGCAAENNVQSKSPFIAGFTLIFLAEWGDKTQVAAAVFASRYNPLLVLLGTVASMTLLSAAAVYLGCALSDKMDRKTTTRVAGILFLLLGAFSLLL